MSRSSSSSKSKKSKSSAGSSYKSFDIPYYKQYRKINEYSLTKTKNVNESEFKNLKSKAESFKSFYDSFKGLPKYFPADLKLTIKDLVPRFKFFITNKDQSFQKCTVFYDIFTKKALLYTKIENKTALYSIKAKDTSDYLIVDLPNILDKVFEDFGYQLLEEEDNFETHFCTNIAFIKDYIKPGTKKYLYGEEWYYWELRNFSQQDYKIFLSYFGLKDSYSF